MSKVKQQFEEAIFPWWMASFVVVVAVNEVLRRNLVHGVVAFFIAAATILPSIGIIILFFRYLREETDDFDRAILVESILWGGALTLALAQTWGFIELVIPTAHHLNVRFVGNIFILITVFSRLLIRLRYR